MKANVEENKSSLHEENQATSLLEFAGWVLFGVLGIAIVITAVFVYHFYNAGISSKTEQWGQTGDFIGGLVNPAVGLGTVILIFIGLRIQRAELKATTTQLEKANQQTKVQAFEQSLFSWLANYHSLLSDILINLGPTEKIEGRRALVYLYDSYFDGARGSVVHPGDVADEYARMQTNLRLVQLSKQASLDIEDQRDLRALFLSARAGYIAMFDRHRIELDAVLRTLFRLFKWIDESTLLPEQRWHYAALVRAQLSWIELAYLLYNACSDEGEPFALYVNRYALLDNLVKGRDKLIEIAVETNLIQDSLVFPSAKPSFVWPLEPRAFSSDIARPIFTEEMKSKFFE